MSKDPNLLLQHILESIQNLEEYLAGIDEAAYLASVEKQDAAERRLQIIGPDAGFHNASCAGEPRRRA